MALEVSTRRGSEPHPSRVPGPPHGSVSVGAAAEAHQAPTRVTARVGVAALLVWTLALTSLRATRLPNDFSKAHWLIDYRFGFVKRGLVGTLLSLTTHAIHVRPTDRLLGLLASLQFIVFCVVLLYLGVRIVRRSAWSTTPLLLMLVFFSSPFV